MDPVVVVNSSPPQAPSANVATVPLGADVAHGVYVAPVFPRDNTLSPLMTSVPDKDGLCSGS